MSEAVVFSEDAACVLADVDVFFMDWEELLLLHPEIKIAIVPVSMPIKIVVVFFFIINYHYSLST